MVTPSDVVRMNRWVADPMPHVVTVAAGRRARRGRRPDDAPPAAPAPLGRRRRRRRDRPLGRARARDALVVVGVAARASETR